jgi:hypothetical protein
LENCENAGWIARNVGTDFNLQVSAGENCETDITDDDNCGGCSIRCSYSEECVESGESWECQPIASE